MQYVNVILYSIKTRFIPPKYQNVYLLKKKSKIHFLKNYVKSETVIFTVRLFKIAVSSRKKGSFNKLSFTRPVRFTSYLINN